jgi:hypothetical protein
MKKTCLFLSIIFSLVTLTILAKKEKSSEIGQTTLKKIPIRFYDKDSTEDAAVL